jgi:hypothetical protein
VLSTAQRKGHSPQRLGVSSAAHSRSSCARAELDLGKAAGEHEALHEYRRGLAPIGTPLAQGPQQQLFAGAKLADDDVGNTGHCELRDLAVSPSTR